MKDFANCQRRRDLTAKIFQQNMSRERLILRVAVPHPSYRFWIRANVKRQPLAPLDLRPKLLPREKGRINSNQRAGWPTSTQGSASRPIRAGTALAACPSIGDGQER